MAHLTEKEVVDMAQSILESNKLGYDPLEGLNAKYSEHTELRNGQTAPVWVVSYVTPPDFFDQHDHFMYISDESKELLYIMTQSGYVDPV